MRALLLALAAASLVGCHSSSGLSDDAGCAQLADKVRAGLPPEAEQSCTKDSDCVIYPEEGLCVGACAALVNEAGAAALAAAIAQANATTCASYLAAGCPSVLLPCLPLPVPHCVAGVCSLAPGPDDEAGADAGSGSTDAASD